jgi:putative transposase
LTTAVLEDALARTICAAGLIVHSDQGWHYKMRPYRAMLMRRGVKQSMSRKGNCFDNAAIESFFGTLKAEYFHLQKPDSVDTLEAGVSGSRSKTSAITKGEMSQEPSTDLDLSTAS